MKSLKLYNILSHNYNDNKLNHLSNWDSLALLDRFYLPKNLASNFWYFIIWMRTVVQGTSGQCSRQLIFVLVIDDPPFCVQNRHLLFDKCKIFKSFFKLDSNFMSVQNKFNSISGFLMTCKCKSRFKNVRIWQWMVCGCNCLCFLFMW